MSVKPNMKSQPYFR